jgi:hypothetical protein
MARQQALQFASIWRRVPRGYPLPRDAVPERAKASSALSRALKELRGELRHRRLAIGSCDRHDAQRSRWIIVHTGRHRSERAARVLVSPDRDVGFYHRPTRGQDANRAAPRRLRDEQCPVSARTRERTEQVAALDAPTVEAHIEDLHSFGLT